METLYLDPDPWNLHIWIRNYGIFIFESESMESSYLDPDPWNFIFESGSMEFYIWIRIYGILYLNPDPWNFHIWIRIHGIFISGYEFMEFSYLNPNSWYFYIWIWIRIEICLKKYKITPLRTYWSVLFFAFQRIIADLWVTVHFWWK